MKKNYAYLFAAMLALTAGYTMLQPSKVQAGDGQTALSKCVDSVVAACNKKKSDDAIAACADSGISQCEKQHTAQIQLPPQGPRAATNFKTNNQNQQHPNRN